MFGQNERKKKKSKYVLSLIHTNEKSKLQYMYVKKGNSRNSENREKHCSEKKRKISDYQNPTHVIIVNAK